jgi:perosamine synthetase
MDESRGTDAKAVQKALGAQGIGSRPFFCPMHQQPILRDLGLFKGEFYPESDRLYKQGFYIPSGMAITNDQIERVAKVVMEVLT